MKSKKAIEYLKDRVYDARALVDDDGLVCAVIKRHDTIIGIDLAEKEMQEEMLRWRDPIKEWPLSNGWVLIKIDNPFICKYAVALYIDGKWDVLGHPISLERCKWRPIREIDLEKDNVQCDVIS